MNKEFGCGKNLGTYMKIPRRYENSSDKIRHQHAEKTKVICGINELCDVCKAVIKSKIQVYEEILEFLRETIYNSKDSSYSFNDKCKSCNSNYTRWSQASLLREQKVKEIEHKIKYYKDAFSKSNEVKK